MKNPQDLALASLPSLEESRISLLSFRGVWSFYEVGPFDDVRAELAFNYDEFRPSDPEPGIVLRHRGCRAYAHEPGNSAEAHPARRRQHVGCAGAYLRAALTDLSVEDLDGGAGRTAPPSCFRLTLQARVSGRPRDSL